MATVSYPAPLTPRVLIEAGWSNRGELWRDSLIPEFDSSLRDTLADGTLVGLIGVTERALECMCARVKSRVAFGKPLAEQGTIRRDIAESRIEIDQARLLTLRAARLIGRAAIIVHDGLVEPAVLALARADALLIDGSTLIKGSSSMRPSTGPSVE